ncbi:hypothetical protein HanXRQr2_Chr05g0200421 [Helianthus annuus]|uniref:Uncharacterized protein n=1 Tax=Helianthus annuus TaxID=4232 RepID=A0A9K3IXS9_HELAN|nr:hypothetical protein HanXRQr2_Chr05g0200421 [Helianthus annuus]
MGNKNSTTTILMLLSFLTYIYIGCRLEGASIFRRNIYGGKEMKTR